MSFRGNPRIRGHREQYEYSEEHLIEYLKCRADFVYWAERYAKVATLDDGIVTIKLRKYQQRMIQTIKNLPKMGKRGMVVLAPRQCGKTTGIYLYILWLCIFFNHKRVAIIANKGANARKVIRDIKQAYEFLPLWMQPGVKEGGWSKGTVELENGSMIVSGSSTSDSIRGSTFHCITGDSEIIVRMTNGRIYKTTMRGLEERDESTFIEINKVYFGDEYERVYTEQVSGVVYQDNGSRLGVGSDRTPSHCSAFSTWNERLHKSEKTKCESPCRSTSFVDEIHTGNRIDEDVVRVCSNGIGSAREILENELVGAENHDSSISRGTIGTNERNHTDSRMEKENRGRSQGANHARSDKTENFGSEHGMPIGYSENGRAPTENFGSEHGKTTSLCGSHESESRENTEDGGKKPWDETVGSNPSIIERTTKGETIPVEGNDGLDFGRNSFENGGIRKETTTSIGCDKTEDAGSETSQHGNTGLDFWSEIEVFTDEGWKRFGGCVNNGVKQTYRLVLENGLSVKATDNHEISTDCGWTRIDSLSIGDLVDTVYGLSRVVSITEDSIEDVYDLLNVEDIHCFYANGIKVHNCIYLDEYAFIPKHAADDFMKSVLPTILSGKSAQLFATSTPKGMNHFWKMWRKAEKGLGMFVPVRVDYMEVENYRDPAFKRMIIETEGLATWRQEFMCAFLGSSKTLINADALEQLALTLPPDPIFMHFNEMFKVWERPRAGCTYIVSADVGKGVGGDFSVAQVLRIDGMHKCEQVACFADNYTPINDFGEICVSIARYYNQSEIIVENNDLGGVLCERIFEKIGYDKLVSYEKDYFGVRSNKKSKAIGNIALREYIENGWIKLNDEKTISEFSFYEELRDGVFGAIAGEHDDRVMSLMWALYFLKSNSEFEDETANQINPRYRINDQEAGYEDTGMGDADADWMGGGGSGGDWLGGGSGSSNSDWMGGQSYNIGGIANQNLFGAPARADHLFSGFGGDESDNIFGSVKAGTNATKPQLASVGGGGYRHPTGATVFEDDLPMM